MLLLLYYFIPTYFFFYTSACTFVLFVCVFFYCYLFLLLCAYIHMITCHRLLENYLTDILPRYRCNSRTTQLPFDVVITWYITILFNNLYIKSCIGTINKKRKLFFPFSNTFSSTIASTRAAVVIDIVSIEIIGQHYFKYIYIWIVTLHIGLGTRY